jgi:tRNA threonylcarbamoyladenosine biosynthesis protein TsaE
MDQFHVAAAGYAPRMPVPDATGVLATDTAAQTRAIGRALGVAAEPGAIVALRGPLGAGKTQLAKGIAAGLGVRGVVNSPTFVLMNEHVGRLRLFHVDAYRLHDPEEAEAAGLFDERQALGVTVVEWADRLDGWLPDHRLEIEITPGSAATDHRILRWHAFGEAAAQLAAAALPRA